MAFLDKEEEKPSALWDWIIGIALLLLIGGGFAFYQVQKRSSNDGFQTADSLFAAGQYAEASRAYEALKNAQYLTPHHDSVIYQRLDSIETLKEAEEESLMRIRTLLAAGDTVAAKTTLQQTKWHDLLDADGSLSLDSMRKNLP